MTIVEIGKEPWWKYVLAWPSALLGGFCLLGIPMFMFESWVVSAGYLYLAIFLGLPGAWWLWCNWQDKKAWAEYAKAAQEHLEYSGGKPASFAPPERKPRHWWIVALIVVLAAVAFANFSDMAGM